MNLSKISKKIQQQMQQFSGKLSRGLPKTAGRFVEEAIYGIQARGTLRLSEIARSLNEEIGLQKTINRLSRQLKRRGLLEHIEYEVLTEGKDRIKQDTLLILDLSDITKPYAKKMEYMAQVRDGSNSVIGEGYWTVQVVGAECSGKEITPLYHELYSQKAPDFISENREIFKAIDTVSQHLQDKNKGVWVIDRGADRRKVFDNLLDHERRFIIRLKGDRHLLYRGKKVLALDLAKSCPLLYGERIIKQDKDEEQAYNVEYGFRKVKLPGRKETLFLVVVKGFGADPMMLLTTRKVQKKRSCLWWIIQAYLTRWRIEETIRFVKQSYELEDIRVLTYDRLRNMMGLVLAASFFAAVYLGFRIKMQILVAHVMKASKRIFGIPDFRYYAIADGIRELLNRYNRAILKPLADKSISCQLALFDP
jgi:hypothetical protein